MTFVVFKLERLYFLCTFYLSDYFTCQ